ncbi:helix-turn-helix transcriptional regulator [Cohnella herbarum]|uniref:Helix-turn-helix transcriptional regulator n=1 Tax=Cohnella herbarum TaxID=2728023 RepID=A0A7Z2VQY2_9BACL|nr:helix-turn-helix transcriptional regulator [Cohnella herbarum]QJD87881.1 helix-turn-helix transcriptional regulator [Cohnella herbarum]
MPDSYPFPMYSGIFEPKHYKQIGAALWFFSWCINSTTKECEEEDGVTWGYVHGKKPMKLSELAAPFGVNDKTVGRWIETLEEHGYIRTTRAPYGLIVAVRNSKKRTDKNVRSDDIEQTNMSDLSMPEQTKMSDHGVILPERTDSNVLSNKDLDLTITTSINKSPIIQLIESYCNLHNKIEFHLKDKERTLMFKMIGDGIPVSLIIETMQAVYRERSVETNITSFLYYKSVIYQAWETVKAITEGVPISPVALGEDSITNRVPAPVVALGSPRRTRPQQELDDLRRKREEARQLEQG